MSRGMDVGVVITEVDPPQDAYSHVSLPMKVVNIATPNLKRYWNTIIYNDTQQAVTQKNSLKSNRPLEDQAAGYIEWNMPLYNEPEEDTEFSKGAYFQLTADSIRINLQAQLKLKNENTDILDAIWLNNAVKMRMLCERGLTYIEKNIGMLYASFSGNAVMLKKLLEKGANVRFRDADGQCALHFSCLSGFVDCIQILVDAGAPINVCDIENKMSPLHYAAMGGSVDCMQRLIDSGAEVLTSPCQQCESVLHFAVRANAVKCVNLVLSAGVDINCFEPNGETPLQVAADLGHENTLQVLLEHGANPLFQTRDTKMTALHYAARNGFTTCVRHLLQKGVDVDARNIRGQTALHLAAHCQSVECVEILLNYDSNPDIQDCEKRTPLHSAIHRSCKNVDVVQLLLKKAQSINYKDRFGYTPLHLAAVNEFVECVGLLIENGADVTARTQGGMSALSVLIRKTPCALRKLSERFDSSVSLDNSEKGNHIGELQFDFRTLTFSSEKTEKSQRESKLISSLIQNGEKGLLKHPLCEAFLYLKWQKIRKYFAVRLVTYAVFVLTFTLYVLSAFRCYGHYSRTAVSSGNATNASTTMKGMQSINCNETNCTESIDINTRTFDICTSWLTINFLDVRKPGSLLLIWCVLAGLAFCEILLHCAEFALAPSWKHYMKELDNILEWLAIISVFLISCVFTGELQKWQHDIAAFAIVTVWANQMIKIGQLPFFGLYIQMFTDVLKDFGTLIIAYFSLIIGFCISFSVIFPATKALHPFAHPLIAVLKVGTMMTGEYEFANMFLPEEKEKMPSISAQIIFLFFLIFMTIILMNLLVGIAVHDIQGLQETAGLERLVRQAELISYIEVVLFSDYMKILPESLREILINASLISPKGYGLVRQVRPNDPRENRLPKDVIKTAYQIAKARRGMARKKHSLTKLVSEDSILRSSSMFEDDDCLSVGQCNYMLNILLTANASNTKKLNTMDAKMRNSDDSLLTLKREVQEMRKEFRTFQNFLAGQIRENKRGDNY